MEKNDEALEAKKVLIMDQIEIIQGKLQQIKSSAEQIQTQITRILEECMNTLMVEVQKKSAILKSDKIELSRQYKEIEFMTQFLNLQARQTSPIEFLQQYAAHNQLKSQLQKQRTTVSDIQVDMKISGKPIIHVDNSIKSVDIQNAVNTDKYSLVDKAKNSLEKQMMAAQRSTGFRTQLLNKGLVMPVVGQRDGPQVMNAASALQEAQGKIPSYSRALESEREQQIQLGPQGAIGD